MSFYDLLCKILEQSSFLLTAEQLGKIKFSTLLENLLQIYSDYKSQELRVNSQIDYNLLGQLNLINRILELLSDCDQRKYTPFAFYLLLTGLFELNPREERTERDLFAAYNDLSTYDLNYIKCKQKETRQSAYNIVVKLLSASDNLWMELQEIVGSVLSAVLKEVSPPANGWNYLPTLSKRSVYNYVGIKNLGAICYMNSMIQQFYINETFRNVIFLSDDQKEVSPSQDSKGKAISDDNLLHQLQRAFGFLELSDQQDYNPYELCFSYKDYQNNPINLMIQQDASEFINLFLAQLETSLKDTPFKNLLIGIYGGSYCTSFQCSVCSNIKERDEGFLCVELEVKNLKTLEESWKNYCKEEIVQDYLCEKCQQKVDTTKKTLLKTIPNVLLIHLQRIVFDLDLLQNVKLISNHEFPSVVNLHPYMHKSMASNPKEEYEYQLKGVVVHQGKAEQGHYYSLIKINDKLWLEFNDSVIKEFNINQFEKECFGAEVIEGDDVWDMNAYSNEIGGFPKQSKSAYVLVYEKVKKTPIKLVFANQNQCNHFINSYIHEDKVQQVNICCNSPAESNNNEDNNNNDMEVEIDYYALKKVIPLSLSSNIWLENHKFLLEKQIFSDDFFQFVSDLFELLSFGKQAVQIKRMIKEGDNNNQEKQALQNLNQFLFKCIFEILPRINDNQALAKLSLQLQYLLKYDKALCLDFFCQNIVANSKQIFEIILTCPDANVRSQFCQLLLFFCKKLKKFQQTTQLLDQFFELLPSEVGKNWLKFNEYFQFWFNFAMLGPTQIAYLFSKDALALLIDFFLEQSSPIQISSQKKVQMGNNYTQPQFHYLIKTITKLALLTNNSQDHSPVLQFSSFVPEEYQVVVVDENNCSKFSYKLSKNAEICLNCPQFYEKILRTNNNILQLSLIARHMSQENESFSRMLSILLLNNFQKVTFDDAKSYLQLLYHFLLVNDSLQMHRIEWILGYPQRIKHPICDSYQITEQLDQLQIEYQSTLNQVDNSAFLSLIFNKRKIFENICMLALEKLLQLINQSPLIFEYIYSLPPPNYLYASYFDWMPDFFIYFQQEYEKFAIASYQQEKAQLKAQAESLYNQIKPKLTQKLNQFDQLTIIKESCAFAQQPTSYILGLSQKHRIISTENLHFSLVTNEPDVILQSVLEKTYFIESQPTGKSNKAFPENVLMDGTKFFTRKIDFQQTLSLFLDGTIGYIKENYLDSRSQWKFFKKFKDKNCDAAFDNPQEKENKKIEENHEEYIEEEPLQSQQMHGKLHKDYIILRYTIINKSINPVNIRLKLALAESEQAHLNALPLPHSFIERQIQGIKNQDILVLTKNVPYIDFPIFNTQIEIDFLAQEQVAINNNNSQLNNNNINNNNIEMNQLQFLPALTMGAQGYNNNSQQKQCPSCQNFIDATHAFCMHCYYDF